MYPVRGKGAVKAYREAVVARPRKMARSSGDLISQRIKGLAREPLLAREKWRRGLEISDQFSSPPLSVYAALFSLLSHVSSIQTQGVIEEVDQLFRRMVQQHPDPPECVLDLMIGILARCDSSEVEYDLREFSSRGYTLSKQTYTLLIQNAQRKRDLSRVTELLDEATRVYSEGDVYFFSQYLSLFESEGQYDRVFELYESRKEKQLPVDIINYRILFQSIRGTSDLELICGDMQASGTPIDEMCCDRILHSLVRLGEVEEAKSYLKRSPLWIDGVLLEIDCHPLTHGAAAVRISQYLDEHPQEDLIVITGYSDNMKQFVTEFLSRHNPTYTVFQHPRNFGRLKVQKK